MDIEMKKYIKPQTKRIAMIGPQIMQGSGLPSTPDTPGMSGSHARQKAWNDDEE